MCCGMLNVQRGGMDPTFWRNVLLQGTLKYSHQVCPKGWYLYTILETVASMRTPHNTYLKFKFVLLV